MYYLITNINMDTLAFFERISGGGIMASFRDTAEGRST